MQPLPKRKMTSRATIMRELPSSFALTDADVFCAKGKKAKAHPGNQLLTSLIHSHLAEYASASTRLEKSFVVSKIMKVVKNKGGSFVRIVNDAYYDIGGRNAREKVGQALRDLLHDQYRSSTRSKACIRRSRIESSESLTTAALISASDGTSPLENSKSKPIAVAWPSTSCPSLETSMATNAVESLTASEEADANARSADSTTAPVTPLATPDEPLSISIFDGLDACLEPFEADFLLHDIDVEQPLPLAQSLVEDVDFCWLTTSADITEDTDATSATPVPDAFASFHAVSKQQQFQQQLQQQQLLQQQIPTMASWFCGAAPTMQNMLMAQQFHHNTTPYLCRTGLNSACNSSNNSAAAFMMLSQRQQQPMPSLAIPVCLNNLTTKM